MTDSALATSPARWRRWGAVFIACWALALATHTSGLVNPVHCDYSTWLRVAQDWHAGHALYGGVAFDNKNPTVFLVVGLIGWKEPAISLYVAETLFAAFAGSILFLALLRTKPRVALLAPMFLIAWSGTSQTFVQGQTTETAALWCDVIAISCAVLAARSGSLKLVAVSGVFAFLAFSARIPCALHVVAYWPIIVRAHRRLDRRKTLQLMAVFAGSFLAAFLAMYLLARADGYWDRFVDVTRYNFKYGAIDRIPMSTSLFRAAKVLARTGLFNPLMVLLVIFSLVLFGKRTNQPQRSTRYWMAIAITWLIAAVVAAYPGGRHYLHYYHGLWAPLSLIAAIGLGEFSRKRPTKNATRIVLRGVLVISVTVAVMQNLYGFAQWKFAKLNGSDHQTPILDAAAFLDESTDDDTPVAMYVWLDNAELYWRVRRESGTSPIPQVLTEDRLEVWSQYVIEHKTPLIVVDPSFDSRESDSEHFHQLKQVLIDDYVEIRRFGDMRFLARRDSRFADAAVEMR